MPKIVLNFTRIRTEVGSVEVDVTDDAAVTLGEPRNLDAWARFTMLGQVKEWKPAHHIWNEYKFTATLDGKAMQTDWRSL